MSINIGPASNEELRPRITVIGVGGAGGNAIANMIAAEIEGVDFVAANTDAQALKANLAPTKIQLGTEITKGLGAGANPEVGRKSALDDYEKISEVIEGADMIFVTVGTQLPFDRLLDMVSGAIEELAEPVQCQAQAGSTDASPHPHVAA